MSALFLIKIEEIEDTTAVISMRKIHPDVFEIPKSKNVALQVLCEAYTRFKPTDSFQHQEALKTWQELYSGKKISISEKEYDDYRNVLNSGDVLPNGCYQIGFEEGKYFLVEKPNHFQFIRASNEIISSVSKEDEKMIDNRLSASLRITVYDASYLSHLTQGSQWDSALFDLRYSQF